MTTGRDQTEPNRDYLDQYGRGLNRSQDLRRTAFFGSAGGAPALAHLGPEGISDPGPDWADSAPNRCSAPT